MIENIKTELTNYWLPANIVFTHRNPETTSQVTQIMAFSHLVKQTEAITDKVYGAVFKNSKSKY